MYYPKSQIITNQYTNGGEFVVESTKQPYTGYYFSTSKGESFTGRTPNDLPNEKLIKLEELSDQTYANPVIVERSVLSLDSPGSLEGNYNINSTDLVNYLNTQGQSLQNLPTRLIPYYLPQLPTEKDYHIKEFRRYFCKKTNEITYIEIDKKQYEKLVNQDPQILFQLYSPFYIDWQLSGDKTHVETVNKNTVELEMFRKKLPKFGDYLRHDYLKYYK